MPLLKRVGRPGHALSQFYKCSFECVKCVEWMIITSRSHQVGFSVERGEHVLTALREVQRYTSTDGGQTEPDNDIN